MLGHTHREICALLKVSPSTVYRVSAWLDEQLPGYAEAVSAKPRRKKKHDYAYEDYSGFKALRKKYPGHFLLFNLAEALTKRAKE